MLVFLYVEMNFFALIILLLIYLNIRRKNVTYPNELKLYLCILAVDALILSMDSLTWIFDGKNDPIGTFILTIANVIYYILDPVICMLWALYIDYQINHDSSRIRRYLPVLLIPVMVNAILALLSIRGDYLFYIDENSVYHRGAYFLFLPAINLFYFANTSLYIICHRKRIHRPYIRTALLFALFPIVGAIVQILYYGVSIIWICMTISILMVFINIQNEQINLDYLTGLFNRRQLDFYLQEAIRNQKEKLAGIMLDLDSFKHINDQYGHYIGDEALKFTSDILKKTFVNQGFISRFGGDEFVILLNIKQASDLEEAIEKLRINFMNFNNEHSLPYAINFSIGAAIYEEDTHRNGQEFLNYIDTLMYEDKQTYYNDETKYNVNYFNPY